MKQRDPLDVGIRVLEVGECKLSPPGLGYEYREEPATHRGAKLAQGRVVIRLQPHEVGVGLRCPR